MPIFTVEDFKFTPDEVKISVNDLDLRSDEITIKRDTIYVTPDDLNIDVDDFIDACSVDEVEELGTKLYEQGWIPCPPVEMRAFGEMEFEKSLSKLHGKWNMLSSVEEAIINKIAKRFWL